MTEMDEELLYSGELDKELYDEVAEQVDGFQTEWIDADVNLMLSGDYELTVEGPETSSILGGSHRPSDTYEVDPSTAEELRKTFG